MKTEFNEAEFMASAEMWDSRKLGAEDEFVRVATPEELADIKKALPRKNND